MRLFRKFDKHRFTLLYHTPPLRVYFPPCPHTLYQTKTEEGLAMRRDADREERNARLLAGVVLAAMLVLLSGIIHLLYHREYAETDTPNDCFAVAAATGETALPKLVCLTFDDGPSKTTPEVLAALDAAGVHGTFFVVATGYNEKYLPLLTQAAAAGHQIALHSASHEYSDIYRSSAAYWKDIALLKQRIAPYVDAESIRYLRFPGGSTNTVSRRYGGKGLMQQLKNEVEQRGWQWVDWNVCAEDAVGGHPSADTIYRNVVRETGEQTHCVVLMHDSATTHTTAEALPDIIRWYADNGYTFLTVAEALPLG